MENHLQSLCLLVAELHEATSSPSGLMPVSHTFCAASSSRVFFPPMVLVKMLQQVLLLLGKTSTVRRVVIFILKSCSN